MKRNVFGLAVLLLLVAGSAPAEAQAPTITGTLAAAGDSVVVSLANIPSETVQLTGTGVGLVLFEFSNDSGTTWYPLPVTALATSSSFVQGQTTQATSTTGIWLVQNAGYTGLRVRAQTLTSGSFTVTATRGFATAVPSSCNPLLRAAGKC